MVKKLIRLALAAALLFAPAAALAQSQINPGFFWGNPTAVKAPPGPASASGMFDRALSSTRGTIIERGAGGWVAVVPSVTAGLAWVSQGTGADPTYGIVGLAGGGCAAALTASNGGILYSTASACAILAGNATARLPLLSGASTTPQWGAYTLPASVTSGGVACFTSTTVQASSGLLTANALLLGGGAGVCPSPMGSLGTTTTVLHGNAGGAPAFSAIAIGELPQDSTTWRTASGADTILNTDCLKTVGLGGNAFFTETLPVVGGFPTGCEVVVKNTDTYTGPGTGRAKRLIGFPTDTTPEGLPQTMLYPQEVVVVKIVNGAWVATRKTGRWINPQGVTLCIDTGGSDSTGDGLVALATAGATCLRTAANAGLVIQKRFDLNQTTPIIAQTVGQSFTDQLSLGGQPTGSNLIQISPNGAGTVNWSNASSCILVGDNAEIDVRLNGINASGNIAFTCNTANSVGVGHIYIHNYGVLDLEGGPPTFAGAGANDHAIFFDGKGIGTIQDGIKVSGTLNYAVNLDQGGKLTHSGSANPSIGIASGAPTLNGLWRLGGASELLLGPLAPTTAGYTSLGPSQINGNSVFVRNGIAAGTFTIGPGGQLCDSLTSCNSWIGFGASPSCGTATITNTSSRALTNGKTTNIQVDFTITALGTCSTAFNFTLPNTANSGGGLIGEEIGAGKGVVCRVTAGSGTANCVKTDVSSFLVNDHFVASGVYENQ